MRDELTGEMTGDFNVSGYAHALYAQGVEWLLRRRVTDHGTIRVVADGPDGRWIYRGTQWFFFPKIVETRNPARHLMVLFRSLDEAIEAGCNEREVTLEWEN